MVSVSTERNTHLQPLKIGGGGGCVTFEMEKRPMSEVLHNQLKG